MLKNPPAVWETWVDPWVREIPWRRSWQHTPVFCLENPHEQRSLEGYSPWGGKELDMTEQVSAAHSKTSSERGAKGLL